ncbi:MAG: PD40 domain-containing protein [Planctomycetes bacterium]|nr:PD40 domain-containing protein [Planctomycetota bacterium]
MRSCNLFNRNRMRTGQAVRFCRLLVICVAALAVTASCCVCEAGEPQRLTSDGRLKFAPTFNDNGREIVFAVHNVPNRVSLMRLKLAGSGQELLYPSMSEHQFDPAFSIDGTIQSFVKSSGSPQLLLIIRHLKQDKEYVFTPQGARSTARTPCITPDGKRVVFTLSAPGGQQIASVNIEGADLRKLTQSTGTNCWPAVSPDGKKIVFSSSREGSFSLYVMNADGNNVQPLTQSQFRDMRPAWSPDGKRIAFTSVRDGNHEIYLIDSDGTNLMRLTHHPDRDDYPAWHPNGKQILSVSERNGLTDLYLFDVPNSD